jgi:hypothetical protein
MPLSKSVIAIRAEIERLIPPTPKNLVTALDDIVDGIQSKQLNDLEVRLTKNDSPTILDVWRQWLLSEGHSTNWVETVIAGEVNALARRLEETNQYQQGTGWAFREALRILSRPAQVGDYITDA